LLQISDFGLSYATLVTAGRMVGAGRTHDLPGLGRFVNRFNVLLSAVTAVVVAGLGWFVFSGAALESSSAPISWPAPWVAYLLGILVSQWSLPGMSLREGGGNVTPMWRLRLVAELLGASACLVALYFGAGLWSLAVLAVTRGLASAAWLRLGDPLRFSTDTTRFKTDQWMKESWPFQWKIGLSWLSGFLIFRAFSPLIMYEKGPVLAGQFGLAIAMMNLLISITLAWPMSQTARYTSMLVGRRFRELDAEFPVILLRSTVLSAIGTTALILLLWFAREQGMVFAERLTAPAMTAVILSCAVVHHIVGCIAVFLRAEGREPMLIPSLVGGLLVLAIVWLTARYGTMMDVAVSNLLMVVAGVPVTALIYRHRRRVRGLEAKES
jgi:hypothetical protein